MGIKNRMKNFLFKMPKGVRNSFYRIFNYWKYSDCREEHKSYGDLNPDVIFYVIRPRSHSVEGLMSLYLNVLRHIEYAERNRYVPIVDFKNYETQYSNGDDENVWEWYFAPLNSYTLEEVYRSKNVILSGLNAIVNPPKFLEQTSEGNDIHLAREFVHKRIKISKAVENRIKMEKSLLDLKNSLGLYLRGTDYLQLQPAGHPVQPTVEQAIEVVDSYLSRGDFSSIFLVTEDDSIFRALKGRYGDFLRIVSYDSFISGYDGKNFLSNDSNSINQLGDNNYSRGMNYLVKLCMLSDCKVFVGGNTCGSWSACTFSEGFESQYIFNLGTY